MKVWVLEDRWSKGRKVLGLWMGEGLFCTTDVYDAVWFVRREDAERILRANPMLNAEPVEREVARDGHKSAERDQRAAG
jgi:hypothetical protein